MLNARIEACIDSAKNGDGFVICYIPEGSFQPYRTEEGRESQFYIRTPNAFQVIPYNMLRTMFYPRSTPVLQVRGELSWYAEYEGTGMVLCRIFVRNAGTASAKDVVMVGTWENEPEKGYLKLREDGWPTEILMYSDSNIRCEAKRALHLGMEELVVSFNWSSKRTASGNYLKRARLDLEIMLVAENAQPLHYNIGFETGRLCAGIVSQADGVLRPSIRQSR